MFFGLVCFWCVVPSPVLFVYCVLQQGVFLFVLCVVQCVVQPDVFFGLVCLLCCVVCSTARCVLLSCLFVRLVCSMARCVVWCCLPTTLFDVLCSQVLFSV